MTIGKLVLILPLILFPLFVNAQTAKLDEAVDGYVQQLRNEAGVPGVALAIIHKGNVVYKKNHGYANLEHEVPVSDRSIFRVYSLTKPMVAVGIFSLIEQNKLDLKDLISDYVDDLPESWRNVQIRHLLTHSSGLPDMFEGGPFEIQNLTEEEAIARVFAMPLNSEPGAEYQYNQTNFWLLKEIIERVTSMPLEDFIATNQFPSSSKERVFFSSDSRDIVTHRTTPYFPFLKGSITIDLPYITGDYMYAANGLNITLDEFIKWDASMRKNQFLSESTKSNMLTPFSYSNSEDESAYGWGIYTMNGQTAYGFSGSLSTMYVTIPESDLSIIYLTNGFANWYSINNVINSLAIIASSNLD